MDPPEEDEGEDNLMPNRMVSTAGGAAQGAMLGSVVPGVGTAVGGALGGLGGFLFGGGGSPEYPDIELSPELMEALTFDDISLSSINPELYQEILNNQEIINRAESILGSRGDGTAVSRRKMQSDTADATERMAGMGLAGTPTGEAMMADFTAKLREQAEQRAFAEQMQGLPMMAGMHGDQYNRKMGLMGMEMGQRNANRANLLEIDKMKNAQAMGGYQAAADEDAAKNQFWSGMFNSGMTGLANMGNTKMNVDFMNQAYGTNVKPWWSL